MTRLEIMREVLSLPAEELAEKIARIHDYTKDDDVVIDVKHDGVLYELGLIWINNNEDPGAEYCLNNYEDCQYLDSYYDSECPSFYGSCRCCDSCPYGVDRADVARKAILESLKEEK